MGQKGNGVLPPKVQILYQETVEVGPSWLACWWFYDSIIITIKSLNIKKVLLYYKSKHFVVQKNTHLKNISVNSSLHENIIHHPIEVVLIVCVFCVCFYIFTCHFLILAAPAEAKVASHFWASCLFVSDPLHLVTQTQRYTSHAWVIWG